MLWQYKLPHSALLICLNLDLERDHYEGKRRGQFIFHACYVLGLVNVRLVVPVVVIASAICGHFSTRKELLVSTNTGWIQGCNL